MMILMMALILMLIMILRNFLYPTMHRELFKSRPTHICHRHPSPRGRDDDGNDDDSFDEKSKAKRRIKEKYLICNHEMMTFDK